MRPIFKTAQCLCLFVGLALFSSPSLSADKNADQIIGQVKVLKGDAYIIRKEKRLDIAEGVDVFLNDEAITGTDGSLGVTLADSTTLSLGPDSNLVIDDFIYEPAGQELGMGINLVQGTLAYVSGAIASLAPESIRLVTPTATIGIRGTKILIKANPK